MVAMMAPALEEAFGSTFASKEDIAEIKAQLDTIVGFCETLSTMIDNARDKGGMVAKMFGLSKEG